jgi:tRNA A22 N-methylase
VNRAGRARRELIVAMTPRVEGVVVDVGADHGHVAHAIGAIATERAPNRIGRRDVPWVVGDGLSMFRRVDVAVIAGMGALSIAGILERGPRPEVAVVVHAQDDPPVLRRWLAANGWRIEAEGLAPEAGRWAEVIRAVPGDETATGMTLDWGPRLLEGDDPHLAPHLAHLDQHFSGLATATEGRPEHARFAGIAAFVRSVRVRRGFAG